MRYTIWSRGRLVGSSDLAFARVADDFRCGWFVPSEEGEQLLPIATSVLTAMCARRDDDAAEMPGPERDDRARHADVAEALHRVAALELELRDAAGSLIPTEDIGIQDTHVLLDLVLDPEDPHDESDGWEMDDDPEVLFGEALDPSEWTEADEEDAWQLWRTLVAVERESSARATALGDESAGPQEEERYQLFVRLVDPASVP